MVVWLSCLVRLGDEEMMILFDADSGHSMYDEEAGSVYFYTAQAMPVRVLCTMSPTLNSRGRVCLPLDWHQPRKTGVSKMWVSSQATLNAGLGTEVVLTGALFGAEDPANGCSGL